MARRRVVEDKVSHERWLISYADFITLLFAFFVVMYSISQVNEGKYKVLSHTLSEAFNVTADQLLDTAELTIDPFQIGEVAKSNPFNLIELKNNAIVAQQQMMNDAAPTIESRQAPQEQSQDNNQENIVSRTDKNTLPDEFKRISSDLESALGALIKQDLITIRGDEQWLEIELKSALLFSSGNANLNTPALEILSDIVDVVRDKTNLIRVEGFTDSIPVNTTLFPSNWELSTARAAAVVHLFVEEGVSPTRLAAIGYSQYQPITEETTEAGRAANRRVVLKIAKEGALQPTLDVISSSATILAATVQVESTADNDNAVPQNSESPEDPMEGLTTIELEGGGLLFTSDPDSE